MAALGRKPPHHPGVGLAIEALFADAIGPAHAVQIRLE